MFRLPDFRKIHNKISWTVLLGLLMVLLSLLYFNRSYTDISHSLKQDVIKHQETYLKEYLQEEILFYLNRGNYALLEEFLEASVANNPLLGYVIVSDAQRRILASSIKENSLDLEGYFDNPAFWSLGAQKIKVDDRLILNYTSMLPGMRRLQFGVFSVESETSAEAAILPVFYRTFFGISLGVFFSIALTLYVGTSSRNSDKKTRERGRSNRFGSDQLNELEQLGQIFNDMMTTLDSNWQENTRLQQQLNDRDFLRSQYLKRVIAAQEDERKRISRELHDQTSQSLTSLMLGLKAIQEAETVDEVKQYTMEYRQLIAHSLEDIQHLAFELRPSALDDLGLVPALKRYVQELSRRKDVNIDFQWQEYSRDLLGESEETVVYRVVQEALTNIVKHASANNVKIRVRIRQEKFVVCIKDDGKGFKTDEIKNKDPDSLGIFGMKERAQLAGGRLYIGSRENRGTMVLLVLPLVKGV